MRDIQKLIGINPDNYDKSIKWLYATKHELLKLEDAIKRTIKKCSIEENQDEK